MTPLEVEDLMEEAARTLRRLPEPNRPRGWFNTWPKQFRTAWEIAGMEPEPMRVLPTPAAISRMERCWDWLRWLEADDARIVWMRAEGRSFRAIARAMGLSRAAAWRRWSAAVITIAGRASDPSPARNQAASAVRVVDGG